MPEHTDPSSSGPYGLEDDLFASTRGIRWTNDGVAALLRGLSVWRVLTASGGVNI
jgi:hypothetical protein